MNNHGHKSNRTMNEDTQELDGSLVTIKGDVNELTNGKVSIMEDADTFKSPYKILQEISNVWDELTDKQQANLAEKLFGKNRANIGISIISNFKQAESAMTQMANSAGAADKEMEIITQSLTYKLNALKETGTGIFQNLFQRDDMGVIISGLTVVLGFIQKFTDQFGLMGTMVAGSSIAVGITKIAKAFKTLSSEGEDPKILNTFLKAFPTAKKGIDAFKDSIASGASGLTAFKAGLSALITPATALIGVLAALTAGFLIFDYSHSGWTRAQEAMDNAVKEYEDADSKLQSLQSDRDSNLESAKEIAAKYNVDVTGLETADEIINKIRNSDVNLSLIDDAELSRLSTANTEVETQLKLQEQLANVKKQAMVTATQKATQAEKSYWEEVKSHHGDGFFGTLAAGWEYINSAGSGKRVEHGEVISDKETAGEKFNAINDKTSLGIARATLEEYKLQKEELDALNQEILDSGNVATQEQIDRRKELTDAIQESSSDLSEYIETLSNQADILGDSPLKTDQEFVKGVKQLFTDFENIGKSAEEIALNNLNNFFDGSGGKNAIRDAFIDAAKEGDSLVGVLESMGLSLRDLGLEESANGVKMLDEYFAEFSKDAEKAEESLSDFRVNADDVKKATESANKDADWSTIQSAYKAAKELDKEGRTGVDDYQTVAQFFSSENLAALAQKAKESGGYAADVYQKAFHDAQAKADRWFGENEAQSLMNFADDMQTKGMFTIDKSDEKGLWDIQSNFKNSAEAAKEMGVSVEAVETLLSGLEAYGYDFSGIEKSSEMFSEYESALSGLKEIYDQMAEGDAKDRLGQLLNGDGGFAEQYNGFLEDMSNLSEEQVIRIKFEYDLSQLQQDIDEIEMQQANGNVTRENNAELLTAQQKYIEKSKEGLGLNQEGIQLPVEFVEAQDSIDSLREQMANTDDPDKILELQARIKKDQELQKEILDEFSETHPEITPETNVDEINSELQKDYSVKVDAQIDASNIRDYLSNFPGASITFTANIDGVESEITAVQNSDGTITYTAVIEGEKITTDDLNKFGTITYDVQTEGDEQPAEDKQATVTYDKDSSVPDSYTAEEKQSKVVYGKDSSEPDNYQPSDKTAKVEYTADTSGLPTSFSTITRYVNYKKTGDVTVDGTAHASGTAFANGNTSGNWGTKSGGVALGGELGEELLVRDGRFFTIGANGAEFFSYRPNDIIFNADQTRQIFEKGAITHGKRRGRALAEGTAFRFGSGNTSTTTSSSNKSSSKNHHHSSSDKKGSSDKKSSSDKESSSDNDEKKRIDWIEVAIDRAEQAIKHLKTLADSVYKSFSGRNQNLQKEIDATTAEINLQKQAWDRYNKEFYAVANEKGLSQDIINKIKNGTIDIKKYDKDTQSAITEAQKYRDKALDAREAIDKLNESISALTKQKFTNIVKEWSDALQTLEHNAERLESQISQTTDRASSYIDITKGATASTENIGTYSSLLNNYQSQMSKRQQELSALNASFKTAVKSGKIAKYSEAYYDMLKEIQSVENEIDKLNEDIIETKNNIAKEYQNVFDNLAQRYDNITERREHKINEFNNYLDLAEAKGLKTSARYYKQLYTLANSNFNEMSILATNLQSKLNSAIASGSIKQGSQAWQEMTERINEAVEAQQKAVLSMQEYADKIREVEWEKFDYLQEKIVDITDEAEFLIGLMEDSDLFGETGKLTETGMATLGLYGMNYNIAMNQADQYAKEILSINEALANDPANTTLIERKKELIEAQRESIEAANDEKKAIKSLLTDGIDKELDHIKELISNYTDALDSQKDLYDYQKKVKNQTENIASLQKQLGAYANDTSEENRARVQTIRSKLKEAQEELQETEYDRMVSDTKKLLDDFYNDYETTLNERLDNVDALIRDVVNTVNSNSDSIASTLDKNANDVGYTISSAITDIWSNGTVDSVLSVYGSNFSSALTTVNSSLSSINEYVKALWTTADAQATSDTEKITTESNAKINTENASTQIAVDNEKARKAKQPKTPKSATYTGLFGDGLGNIYYYVNGKKQSGWKNMNAGKRYFSVKNNKMLTGEQWIGGSTYYFDKKTGVLRTGTFTVNGITYQTDKNGKIIFKGTASNSNKILSSVSGIGTLKKSYASGSKRVGYNGLAWTNEKGAETILRASDKAVLTRVGSDDRIYNAMASENLWKAANNPSKFIADNLVGLNNIASVGNGSNIEQNFENINFVMPNVKNYSEMVSEMQRDPKFEKLIQAMTISRLNGKTSDYKRHISF